MAPVRRQAITCANVDVLSTNISEIWIKTKRIFSSLSMLNCGDAWNLSLKTGVVKIQDDNLAVTGSRRGNIMFSLRADCGRVIVYPGLKQWERPRHNIFGVCTRLAGGVCMSTSANSSASKHLTVTKIVWKIVYVTFDYLISHFFKILSLEFMANLFRDFRASVSLKVFHYRLRGKWCQYDLEIN